MATKGVIFKEIRMFYVLMLKKGSNPFRPIILKYLLLITIGCQWC